MRDGRTEGTAGDKLRESQQTWNLAARGGGGPGDSGEQRGGRGAGAGGSQHRQSCLSQAGKYEARRPASGPPADCPAPSPGLPAPLADCTRAAAGNASSLARPGAALRKLRRHLPWAWRPWQARQTAWRWWPQGVWAGQRAPSPRRGSWAFWPAHPRWRALVA